MILLTPTQHKIYMHISSLGPVGEPVEFNTRMAYDDLGIHRQTCREALNRLSERKLIQRRGQLEVIPLIDPKEVKIVANPSFRPSRGALRLLEFLVRNYAMGINFRVDTWEVMHKMRLHNKANFIRLLVVLKEIGAIEQEEIDADGLQFTIKLLKRPEEYEQAESTKAAASRNETQRLANQVAELSHTIFELQMQKPIAWLWKPKGAAKWKDSTIHPPTKDDLKTLDFKPLFDNDGMFDEVEHPVYVHVKSGGEYRLLTSFKWEEDCEESILYRAEYDGSKWGRRERIFNDGRFVRKEPTE